MKKLSQFACTAVALMTLLSTTKAATDTEQNSLIRRPTAVMSAAPAVQVREALRSDGNTVIGSAVTSTLAAGNDVRKLPQMHVGRLLRYLADTYVGYAFLAILWALGKGRLAGFLADQQKRRADPRNLRFTLTDGKSIPERRIRIVAVHGTWALRGEWHRKDSAFMQRLAVAFAKEAPRWDVEVVRYLWSGGNTVTDRAVAVERLRNELALLDSRPTVILAHSHGGNIALRAMLQLENMQCKVQGLISVATPYLVTRVRRRRFAIPLALVNALLISALGVYAVFGVEGVHLTRATIGAYSVFAIVLLLASIWQARRIKQYVPSLCDPAAQNALRGKLQVIRVSGDEAGASLGAGYILGYAARVTASVLAGVLQYPLQLAEYMLPVKGARARRVTFEVLQLIIGATVAAGVIIVSAIEPPWPWLKGLMEIVLAVSLLSSLAVIAVWILRLVGGTVRIALHSVLETLVSGALLPFGPETSLASPFVIMSAEAAPALGEDASFSVPVLQIPPVDSNLQHSFLRHSDTIARVVAQTSCSWLRSTSLLKPANPSAA